jgi:hypothetical protein
VLDIVIGKPDVKRDINSGVLEARAVNSDLALLLLEESKHAPEKVHIDDGVQSFGGIHWDYPAAQIDSYKASCGGLVKKNRMKCMLRDFFNG